MDNLARFVYARAMNYPGSKNQCYQQIINQIPPHGRYFELFLGGGAVYRHKRPSALQVGLDVDTQTLADFQRAAAVEYLDSSCWADLGEGRFAGYGRAQDFLRQFQWRADDFIYLDPPYLGSSRKSSIPLYRVEMLADDQHAELLELAANVPARVAISGYASDLYQERLKGWRLHTFTTPTRQGSALEHLWMNYPEPAELHEYGHLGQGFVERQRIKRKKDRWLGKLRTMPTLERLAVMAAIEEFRAEQPGAIDRTG